MSNAQAPRLLLMSPEDNCLIARAPLAAGEALEIDGAPVILPEDVPLGYKVARGALKAGDKVLRYGAIIGTVTADVASARGYPDNAGREVSVINGCSR